MFRKGFAEAVPDEATHRDDLAYARSAGTDASKAEATGPVHHLLIPLAEARLFNLGLKDFACHSESAHQVMNEPQIVRHSPGELMERYLDPTSEFAERDRPDRRGTPLETNDAPNDPMQEAPGPFVLEQAIHGYHLRAARALLDWPMPILAKSSTLSVSTVKRLEDGRDAHPVRSRRKAILALHAAGIRFILLEDGAVAVARSPTLELC